MGREHWKPSMEFSTAEIKVTRVMIAPSRALRKYLDQGLGVHVPMSCGKREVRLHVRRRTDHVRGREHYVTLFLPAKIPHETTTSTYTGDLYAATLWPGP